MAEEQQQDRYADAEWVAETLGVSKQWVYDNARKGRIPSYKFGGALRFRTTEILEWARDHEDGPKAE